MCVFSTPSAPPPLPSNPVEDREKEAKDAQEKTKQRLAKRKGGREFLSPNTGFSGIADTLLGTRTDKL